MRVTKPGCFTPFLFDLEENNDMVVVSDKARERVSINDHRAETLATPVRPERNSSCSRIGRSVAGTDINACAELSIYAATENMVHRIF